MTVLLFLAIVGVCVWVVFLMGLTSAAFDAMDESRLRAYGWGAVTIVAFAAPLAIVMTVWPGDADPYPRTLCVRGHQQWVTRHRARMSDDVVKAWFCDEWGAER